MADDTTWHEGRHALQRFINRVNHELGAVKAEKIIDSFLDEFGGFRVSVPSRQMYEQMVEKEKIYNLFTGNNIPELALRFGKTERSIRQIINNHRERRNR